MFPYILHRKQEQGSSKAQAYIPAAHPPRFQVLVAARRQWVLMVGEAWNVITTLLQHLKFQMSLVLF